MRARAKKGGRAPAKAAARQQASRQRRPPAKATPAPEQQPEREPGETTPPRPGLVSRAEVSRHFDVAPARVNRWVEDGCPVAVAGRRGHQAWYDLEAVEAWRREKEAAAPTVSLEQAKIAESEARRERLELQNAVFRGELVQRSQAIAEGQAVLHGLKAQLMNLPRQAVMRGVIPREQEPVLAGMVRDALRELSRWKLEDFEAAAGTAPAGEGGAA